MSPARKPRKSLTVEKPVETLGSPNLFDKSTAQVIVAPLYDGLLYRYSNTDEMPSYQELRDCSKHPLVKLALDLLTGELEGVRQVYESLLHGLRSATPNSSHSGVPVEGFIASPSIITPEATNGNEPESSDIVPTKETSTQQRIFRRR